MERAAERARGRSLAPIAAALRLAPVGFAVAAGVGASLTGLALAPTAAVVVVAFLCGHALLRARMRRLWRRAPPPPLPDSSRRTSSAGETVVVTVGRGLSGVVVGVSSVADALSLFGNDGTCHRITGDSIDGAALDANPSLTRAGICRITYEDDHLDEHPVGRHLNPRRPHAVAVDSETGIVTALEFGANQRQVATEEGLRVESRRADMLERYGDDFELEEGERLDRYRYAAGIEVWIGRESDQVEGFRVVPAEPKASIAGRVGSELDDMAGVLINLTALRAIASEPTFDPALPKPATLPGVGPVLPARSELTLRVGHGIAAIVLHESTVEDVLAFYGTDCRCSCSGRDALPGDAALDRGDLPIWRISYAYDREGEYQPGRPENRTRPCDYFVDSESRRIQTIKIGVYQKELRTAEGLGVYSRLADVLALYGPPDHSSPGDPIDTHVYDRGLTVCVDRESEDVISLELTRARGRDEPSRLGAPRESEGRA